MHFKWKAQLLHPQHSDSQYKGGWMLLPSWRLAQRYLHVSWSWGLAGSCAKRGELRWSDIFVVSFFTTLHGWHSRHWSSPLYSCVATRGIGEVWSRCDGDTAYVSVRINASCICCPRAPGHSNVTLRSPALIQPVFGKHYYAWLIKETHWVGSAWVETTTIPDAEHIGWQCCG